MRPTLPIVSIAIAVVSGCAESRELHRPTAGRVGARDSPAASRPDVSKPLVKKGEVYNSPTLWQSFKSIRMAQNRKTVARKGAASVRENRPAAPIGCGEELSK